MISLDSYACGSCMTHTTRTSFCQDKGMFLNQLPVADSHMPVYLVAKS